MCCYRCLPGTAASLSDVIEDQAREEADSQSRCPYVDATLGTRRKIVPLLRERLFRLLVDILDSR